MGHRPLIKLTKADVVTIRNRARQGEKYSRLANEYGISRGTVANIRYNFSYGGETVESTPQREMKAMPQQETSLLLPMRATSRIERTISLALYSIYLNRSLRAVLPQLNHVAIKENGDHMEQIIVDHYLPWLYGCKLRREITLMHLRITAIQKAKKWYEDNARKHASKLIYPPPIDGGEPL